MVCIRKKFRGGLLLEQGKGKAGPVFAGTRDLWGLGPSHHLLGKRIKAMCSIIGGVEGAGEGVGF